MTEYRFNDDLIQWQTLPNIKYLQYSIMDIDEQHHIIDVLFKFSANQQIILHRHKVLNKTFVIQGEHRLYQPDGSIKEIRQVGRYTSSPACEEPHREGGGEVDAIVLFSIRGSGDLLYEILDAEQNVVGALNWQDFLDLYTASNNA